MMKNVFKILLLATTVLWVACSDDKDSWDSDSRELTIGKLTVVTALRGDTAIAEATSNFFLDEDKVEFQYNHAGASPVTFTCEMTDNGWSDLSKALYYSQLYPEEPELESFTVAYGNRGLTPDQRTEESYHAAHYLKGDAYVKSRTFLIRADSVVNQHVKVIVKIQKSSKWSGSSDFFATMNQDAVVIHTANGEEVLPFYDDSQDDRAIYSAILPVAMVPAAGNAIFTIQGKAPVVYTSIDDADAPTAGQTLIVNARYDNSNLPVATAVTKNVWDTFEGMPYGYPLVEEIYDLNDLDIFAASVSSGVDYTGKEVRLMNNLDIEYERVETIGTRNRPFNGVFQGRGNTISHLTVATESANTGLFGSVGVEGTVKELILSRAKIESTQSYTAGIAGSNYGYIVACQTSDCEVTGHNYVASIVGYNEGTIVGCGLENDAVYTRKDDEAIAGGVAGYNYKRIIACRANPNTVQVTRASGNRFGALVGEAPLSATIDRCAWSHAELPALAAGGYAQPIENSTASTMNQAISEYNSSLQGNEERSCSRTW